MIRTLSFDPGESNFAVAVLEHRVDPVREVYQSRALLSGHLKSTITTLRSGDTLREQARGLYNEVDDIFREFGPFDDVSLERFMARGVKVGTTSETTNMMIGAIAHKLYTIDETPFPELVNASTWKVEFGKVSPLDAAYRICATTPHQLDAALIGVYRACKLMEMRTFEMFSDEQQLHRLMWWLERVSDERLVKRRTKRLFHPTHEDWYSR